MIQQILCSKLGCYSLANVFTLKNPYCVKHYRWITMRNKCQIRKKRKPSFVELELMLLELESFRCRACRKHMIWTSSYGPLSDVISLQHNRDGTMEFICQGCNCAHAKLPGDTFYDIPEGQKLCRHCEKIKPLKEFVLKNGSRTRIGRDSYCKPCKRIKSKEWRKRKAIAS